MARISRGSVHLHAPMPRHLNCHMGGSAEAVKSQLAAGLDPRKPQRAKSNNPRAKERRRLFVRKSFRNGINKPLWRDNVFRIPAVHRITSKLRRIAQILRARSTV